MAPTLPLADCKQFKLAAQPVAADDGIVGSAHLHDTS